MYNKKYGRFVVKIAQNAGSKESAAKILERGNTMFHKKRIFVRVTAFAVILAMLATVFVGKTEPLMAAEAPDANLGQDMSRRLEASPFGAFAMIAHALEDGVVSVSYYFSDYFTSGNLNISLHSDEANREYKLVIDFDVEGLAFDLELHLDRQRIAVSSGLLGEGFYGFYFETFRDDFRPFAGLLGISDADFEEIAGMVDFIIEIMNAPQMESEIWEPYEALIRQFIIDGAVSSEGTTMVLGQQEINVTRSVFRFTDEDMVRLLWDAMTTMSGDRSLDPFGMLDEIMSDFEIFMDELSFFESEIYIILYIGLGNRLIKLEADINLMEYATTTNVFFEANFGTSVFDTWYFSYIITTELPCITDTSQTSTSIHEVVFTWEFTENQGRYVNTVEASSTTEISWWNSFYQEVESWASSGSGRIVSDWDSGTGAFILSYRDDEVGDLFNLTGTYLLDSSGGFLFKIESTDSDYETFSLEVVARIGANIQQVRDFTSIGNLPIGILLDLLF